LGYNAYCNFIATLLSSGHNMEEELIFNFTKNTNDLPFVELNVTHQELPIIEFFDPDLLLMTSNGAGSSVNKYIRFFCALNYLYGYRSEINYEKARVELEFIIDQQLENKKIKKNNLLLTSARYHLSYVYENGLGVPDDFDKAFDLYPYKYYS